MSVKAKPDAPIIKNSAAAPVVFFDDAPLIGHFSGNIELELTARVPVARAEGVVGVDRVCVAHMRCSMNAAMALAQGLTKAVQMAQQSQEAERKPLDS